MRNLEISPPALKKPLPGARRFAVFAWAVLAYNVAVVLWGAVVRVTGSGAGCGNHWPLCNGMVSPLSATAATRIEFTHRAMSGLDAVLVLMLLAWAFRAFPRGHAARLGAALSAVFLLMEVLIGAALVLLEHVAKNASVGRAYSLTCHLINTLTLLACLTLTAWWAGGKSGVRPRGRMAWMSAASLVAVVVLGISGAIAALGDTLFPASSLAAGFAQDLDPAANVFLRLRLFHPMMAVGVGTWLLFFAGIGGRAPGAKRLSRLLIFLVVAQGVAGMANLLLLAPAWMQVIHLLLADALWIALVLVCAATLARTDA